MKLLPLNVTEKYKIEICFVNLIMLFYLFRAVLPILKFPFLLLYFGFIVYSLITYKKQIISNLIEFVLNYYLLLFLALILVISFLLSNKVYLMIFKDVINMIILLSILIISTLVVCGKREFKLYVSNLVYLTIFFAFVISILRLLDLFDIISYNSFSLINETIGSSSSESLYIDSNFALLPVFFGMIGIFYLLQKTNSKLQNGYFNFLLIIFSLNIILSGSRRGLILLIVIFSILTIAKLISLFTKNKYFKKTSSNCDFYIFSTICLLIILNLFFYHTSYKFKNKTLEYLGTKNIVKAKYTISLNLFRYVSVIDKKISYLEYHDKMWDVCFVPEDPDSGWGSRVHKTILPLTGKNVDIVPHGAKGYLMDSTCNASYYSGNDVSESFSIFANLNASKGDYYKASVYCFVSDSFDVNKVSLAVTDACFQENIVYGNVSALYNLENKEIWQKLEIDFVSNGGNVPILINFWKSGVKNFSKLKGYVIFAYPIYEKINKEDNSLPSTLGRGKYTSFISTSIVKNVELYNNNTLIFLNKKNQVYNPIINKQYYSSGFFYSPFLFVSALAALQEDLDPVRNLASKFISEDTTYYPYKANIVLDTISNSFIGDRVSRWKFAFKIYLNEYSWKQKLFGGGFNFLNWYGYYFDKDKTRSDYPHNPFLSILLYSGIFGLIIYLIFMYKVFYYYVKYLKEYQILAVFFIITFFFSFFSAGSPFDPPIMGFFVILPFFIHSIYEKKKAELFDDNVR